MAVNGETHSEIEVIAACVRLPKIWEERRVYRSKGGLGLVTAGKGQDLIHNDKPSIRARGSA